MSKLTLQDLKPKEATFTLDAFPNKKFTLKKWSLAAKIWVNEQFTPKELEDIFANNKLPQVAQIVYYLLKDKEELSFEALLENVCTFQDQVNLIAAVLTTIGLAKPIVKKTTQAENAPGKA